MRTHIIATPLLAAFALAGCASNAPLAPSAAQRLGMPAHVELQEARPLCAAGDLECFATSWGATLGKEDFLNFVRPALETSGWEHARTSPRGHIAVVMFFERSETAARGPISDCVDRMHVGLMQWDEAHINFRFSGCEADQ